MLLNSEQHQVQLFHIFIVDKYKKQWFTSDSSKIPTAFVIQALMQYLISI